MKKPGSPPGPCSLMSRFSTCSGVGRSGLPLNTAAGKRKYRDYDKKKK